MCTATSIITKCSRCNSTQGTVRGTDLCFNCFVSRKDEASNNGAKDKSRVRHEEDDIQKGFFTAARQLFPHLGRLLFAVPNGGYRATREAGRLKAQGVTSGVADIICLIPAGGYNCLCLETKTNKGVHSDNQIEFQHQIEAAGGKYELFRSVGEGIEILQNYLKSDIR